MSRKLIALPLAASLLSGCASWERNPPLLFGEVQTIGISVGGSAPEQGGSITVGYRSQDIAIVPATIAQGADANTQVKATAGEGFVDALSVLGQFEATVESARVGLGRFFATGQAAKKLADGFACRMGEGQNCKQPGGK
jgi:hypothetical protein